MNMTWARLRRFLALLAIAPLLNACIVLFGGAALGGAIVATDRRSVGIQLADAEIEHHINSALDARFVRESVRIDVTSFSEKVLLAGKVPSEKDRTDAEAIARNSPNVRQVINELAIGDMAGLSNSTDDSLLAGKVRAALLEIPGLSANVVKVHCTDGSIFLFGRVSASEAEVSKRGASHINGVRRVVALFDVVPESELAPSVPGEGAGTSSASAAAAGAPAAAATAPQR